MTLVARTDIAPSGPARPRAAAAASGGEGVDFAIVDDHDAFLALRADWDGLFARAALPHQVFQSHVVLRHWARHYLDGRRRLLIVTARRRGRLVMVWPLVARRWLGVETASFMGAPAAQFGDVLVEPGPERAGLLAAGWERVRAHGIDLFEARKVRADSAIALSGLLARSRVTDRQEAPFADLGRRVGPEDGPSQAYPARERSNHRRRLRRLAERGAVSLGMVPPGPEAAALAGAAIAMKQAALQRHGAVAPTISDPRFSAFFRDLAADAEGGSSLRIATIRCAGEAIGIDLSFDCKGVSFGHVIATHPDHERGGVGGLLVHHSFASARARGAARFDLLAPADPYKRDHADGFVAVTDCVLPLTLKGRVAALLSPGRWRPLLKSAMRTLPPPVTRRLATWANSGKS